MGGEPTSEQRRDVDDSEYWRQLLSGEHKGLDMLSRVFRSIPSAPRCKLCHAPFKGPVAPLFKLFGFRRWALNQQLCRFCVTALDKHKGGAEISVSLLFADVRGSTTLAEQMTPSDYTASLERFFSTVFQAVDSESGVIDHIVGDGVMAMWIPGFVGQSHPERAHAAGRKLASDLASAPDLGDSFPAGVGVHTGIAYVGVVGEQRSHDFTVLGDAPNTTARLGSAASGGELAMSDDIVSAAHVDTTNLERRLLDLKGKAEEFPAWIETVPPQQEANSDRT
jgi:adenylate cyclase